MKGRGKKREDEEKSKDKKKIKNEGMKRVYMMMKIKKGEMKKA